MGTTADKLSRLSRTKSLIREAIEAKGVSVGDVPFSAYPEKISGITGGAPAPGGDRFNVRWIDSFDGGVLKEERVPFGAEVSPPEGIPDIEAAEGVNPRLVYYGISKEPYALGSVRCDLDIGICRKPADGSTWVYLTFAFQQRVIVNFNKSDSSTLEIDWKDGSGVYTTTATGTLTAEHTYQRGRSAFTMRITQGSGTYGFGHGGNPQKSLVETYDGHVYGFESVFIGDRVARIDDYAFANCHRLSHVCIPPGVESVGRQAFLDCHCLSSVVCANTSFGVIEADAFKGCYSLSPPRLNPFTGKIDGGFAAGRWPLRDYLSVSSLVLPEGVAYTDRFSGYTSLRSVVIPQSVTRVAEAAFQMTYSLTCITFLGSTPPPADDFSAFMDMNPHARIYVPAGSLQAYADAANWGFAAGYLLEDTPENRALFGDKRRMSQT